MIEYDYKCKICGKTETYSLPIDHEPPKHCGEHMTKVYKSVGFILKGEGWSKQGYEKPNEYEIKNNWKSMEK